MLLLAVTALRVTRETSDWITEAVEEEPAEEPPLEPQFLVKVKASTAEPLIVRDPGV